MIRALLFAAMWTILACCSQTGQSQPIETADTVATADSVVAAPVADSLRLTFALVGDVMMGTTFPDSIHGTHLPPEGGKHLFDDIKAITQRADIAAGNLEGSFLKGPGKRRPMRNPNTYFIFRMPPQMVGNLTDAGFDFMGVANNHINDFGQPGRTSTVKTLHDAGLSTAGLRGVCEKAILERKGLKIGITQFGHGGNNLDVNDLSELRRVVGELRGECDIVVVSFHGGAEGKDRTHVPHKPETYVGERRGDVARFAHAAVDAGADVVFGHGPHVPRAAELYKDRIIFYSLGNFCTPYRMGLTGVSGYAPVAEVTIDGKGRFVEGKIHSFIQQRGKGPRKDSMNAAARLMRRLSAEDFPASKLVIGDDGTLSIGASAPKH